VAAHDGAQSKRLDSVLADVGDGFVDGIGGIDELHIVWTDGADAGHFFDDQLEELKAAITEWALRSSQP